MTVTLLLFSPYGYFQHGKQWLAKSYNERLLPGCFCALREWGFFFFFPSEVYQILKIQSQTPLWPNHFSQFCSQQENTHCSIQGKQHNTSRLRCTTQQVLLLAYFSWRLISFIKFKVKLKDRSKVEIINLQMQTFRFDVFYLYFVTTNNLF